MRISPTSAASDTHKQKRASVFLTVLLIFLVLALYIRWARPRHAAPRVADVSKPRPEVVTGWDSHDSYADGTPDFLRLDSPNDEGAFRLWFTLIAEFQALRPPAEIPAEINDCAALIRYSYRNALVRHDQIWTRESHVLPPIALTSVEKYRFPSTPLAGALFRVRPGSFAPNDLKDGTFAEFADAKTLREFNMHLISRDVRAARPGDVLFFRQVDQDSPFHSMIFVGRSQWNVEGDAPSTDDLIVYHTGTIGTKPGEMRRIRMADLLNFPSPKWRPFSGNSNFLGVYRWNILRGTS
jgi:uncharacterized protein YfaT (DUF1175 family)